MKPVFTIITANYNGYHLMNKYFESLEKQSFKDFEIIIIDDCSTDDSYSKLLEYSKNSKTNIKILKTKENSGPGEARNIGIKNATGEYIAFVDNDDWLEYEALKDINKIISKNKYDCIIYDYIMDFGEKKIISSSMYGNFNGEIKKEDAIIYVRNHTACKFYKASIIKSNNIYYPNIRRHEDIAFVGKALVNCDSFYYFKKPLYHYVQYKNSLSKSNKIDDSTLDTAYLILKDSYKNQYEEELKEKSVIDLLYNKVFIMCKNKKSNKIIRSFIKQYEESNANWHNYTIVKYVGLTKRIYLMLIKFKFINMLKLITSVRNIIGG